MSTQPTNRFVDTEPWVDETDISAPENADMDAPAWLLTWRKFRRHKLALISGIFLLTCYLILPIAGFIAPYTPNERSADYLYAPPQSINLWHEGKFVGPYVYPITAKADLEQYRWTYTTDETTPVPLEFFCEGRAYTSLVLFPPTPIWSAHPKVPQYSFGVLTAWAAMFSAAFYTARSCL